MQDRPTASELAEALREFLGSEVLPELSDPRTRFRTLVAMNALDILGRELAQEEPLLRAEAERLARLLDREPEPSASLAQLKGRVVDLNRDLAERIRSGVVPEGTLGALKHTIEGKLEVASPRYLERYER